MGVDRLSARPQPVNSAREAFFSVEGLWGLSQDKLARLGRGSAYFTFQPCLLHRSVALSSSFSSHMTMMVLTARSYPSPMIPTLCPLDK